jgi:lysophospholipase L1-like esterase
MPFGRAWIRDAIASFACAMWSSSIDGCSSTDGTVHAEPTAETPRTDAPPDDARHAMPVAHSTAPPAPTTEEPGVLAPFHIVGRFDDRESALRIGWPGTEIRARFSGAWLKVDLGDSGTSHFDVAIDGGAPKLLVVTGARRSYDVAIDLAPGLHELVLTKRTETFTGVTQFFGFVGTIVPSPAPRGRRIELIGDSITCGYGVLGANETCPFSADTESEPSAWGALAAKDLGALHAVTAVSGMGVFRNYDGGSSDTMPARYDRALAEDPTSSWAHGMFEPDVLVVNLGTNDFGGGNGDPGAAFQTAYTKLLADLRAKHASAHIVTTTSPMLSGNNRAKHRVYLDGAIATRASAGDTKITLLDLPEQDELDGYCPGVDWHRRGACRGGRQQDACVHGEAVHLGGSHRLQRSRHARLAPAHCRPARCGDPNVCRLAVVSSRGSPRATRSLRTPEAAGPE